jgi:hypothetical protein
MKLWRLVAALCLGSLVVLAGLASGRGSAQGPPVNTAAPTIGGILVQGHQLAVAPGSWDGTQPISFQYQWQRCDASGGGCVDIAGATTQQYLLTSADAGHRLRVGVGASNSVGSSAVLTAATELVAAAVVPTTTQQTTTTGKTGKAQCKHHGWVSFTMPVFRNQGQCVRFFSHTQGDDDQGENENEDDDGAGSGGKISAGSTAIQIGGSLKPGGSAQGHHHRGHGR